MKTGRRVSITRAELRALRRLAARGEAHPDPEVRRRAVDWARHPRPGPAAVVLGVLGLAALGAGVVLGSARLVVLVGFPVLLLAAAQASGPWSAQIHRVNLSAELEHEPEREPEPLDVAPAVRRRRRHVAAYAALLLCAAAAVATRGYILAVVCLGLAALGLFRDRRAGARPRLPARLDADGLHLPASDIHLPWAGVTAVDLLASPVDPILLGVTWRRPAGDFELWFDPRDHRPEDLVRTTRAYLAAGPS